MARKCKGIAQAAFRLINDYFGSHEGRRTVSVGGTGQILRLLVLGCLPGAKGEQLEYEFVLKWLMDQSGQPREMVCTWLDKLGIHPTKQEEN